MSFTLPIRMSCLTSSPAVRNSGSLRTSTKSWKYTAKASSREWVRYRKITGPPFSEKNNRLVWTSAIEQVSQMVSAMEVHSQSQKKPSHSKGWVLPSVPHDVWTNQEFDDLGPIPAHGHRLTFTQSIHTLLRYLIPVMVIPKTLLRLVPIPIWSSAFSAYSEFRDYIFLLTQRAKGVTHASSTHENLLRALVSNSADESVDDRLSDSEVLAHMFVFVLAGHESTAYGAIPSHPTPRLNVYRNALSYAIVNLALYPEAQDWFIQQFDEQLAACQAGSPRDWDYNMFDNLPAVICLMNETLRLYPTVAGVPKWTAHSSVPLVYNDRKCLVPPKTPVVFNTIALHRSPELWGDDVAEFRPQRWVEKQPRKGQFMAFSEGARACLGKKFAQVEFVAVIAALFSRFRVELDCGNGDIAAARKRAAAAFDSSVVLATLGMTKEVPIRDNREFETALRKDKELMGRTVGYYGTLGTTESFFYTLDTLPLFIAIAVYVPVWPGRVIQESSARDDANLPAKNSGPTTNVRVV
ncbi:cytochrome P450 [Auricularia subglabra TFB-10046 SS5]|uniref:Cytochrome P450 n=1 Tax=Auricularia subglabra (strain TFB-10046 / SS5) TaxID=717982 RepID=J0DD07_AURST|nr:cytochrome P450 [Auricularia subglabra TFB-10046 SS5]